MKAEKIVLKPENMTIYEAQDIQLLFSDTLKVHQSIEVDLSLVGEFDSAGLQLMIALKNDALQQKKEVLFTGFNREVTSFLELFNMNAFFVESVTL